MMRREKYNFVDRVESFVVPFFRFHVVSNHLEAIASDFVNSLVFKNDTDFSS